MVKQCERLSCDLEDTSLNQGCLPIYENKCCPNNYYCRKSLSLKIIRLSSNFCLIFCFFIPKANQEEAPKKAEELKTGKCYFNGKNYDVGSKLKTDNSCLDCQCKIPPYFTCVIKEKCEE